MLRSDPLLQCDARIPMSGRVAGTGSDAYQRPECRCHEGHHEAKGELMLEDLCKDEHSGYFEVKCTEWHRTLNTKDEVLKRAFQCAR